MSSEINIVQPDYFTGRDLEATAPDTPPLVIKQTSNLLDYYFNGVSEDPRLLNDFLSSKTMGFLRNVSGGINHIRRLADLKGTKYVDSAVSKSTPMTPPGSSEEHTKNIEAFSHALVIFSSLPDRYSSPLFSNGFSRGGILKPPATVQDFWQRTYELFGGIHDVIDSTAPRGGTPFLRTPKVMRTYAFFNVGAQIPLKEEASKRDFGDILDYLKRTGELPSLN